MDKVCERKTSHECYTFQLPFQTTKLRFLRLCKRIVRIGSLFKNGRRRCLCQNLCVCVEIAVKNFKVFRTETTLENNETETE